MFRKWRASYCCFSSVVIRNDGIKIAHFSSLLFSSRRFLSTTENAPCALNSKFKSLCISDRQANTGIVICFDWYRGMWNACYGHTWFSLLLSLLLSLLMRGHLSRQKSGAAREKRINRRRNIFIMFYKTSHILFLLLAQIREMSISLGLWILASKYLHNPSLNRCVFSVRSLAIGMLFGIVFVLLGNILLSQKQESLLLLPFFLVHCSLFHFQRNKFANKHFLFVQLLISSRH